jgi:hypothetical protein
MAITHVFHFDVGDVQHSSRRLSCFSKSDKFRTVTSNTMFFPAIEMGLGDSQPTFNNHLMHVATSIQALAEKVQH